MNNTILYVIVSLISVILLVIFVQYLYVLVTHWKNRKIKQNIGESTRIRLIHQLREAIEYLADNKIGAIITIENNDNLDMLRTDGVIIDANISSSLIISIFNKSSPLHDGAIIIRGSKIHYASTYYKITKKSIDNKYGARHRAAMGISEISDATTLVVSEESGGVSLTKNSVLVPIKRDQLQQELVNIFKNY